MDWKHLAVFASFGLWLFAGAIHCGAVVGTRECTEAREPAPGIDHWATWKLNWPSNLLGYAAFLLLAGVLVSSMMPAASRWRTRIRSKANRAA